MVVSGTEDWSVLALVKLRMALGAPFVASPAVGCSFVPWSEEAELGGIDEVAEDDPTPLAACAYENTPVADIVAVYMVDDWPLERYEGG